MAELDERILEALGRPSYTPLKLRQLAKRMDAAEDEYPAFRNAAKQLIRDGKVQLGGNQTLRLAERSDSLLGTYRRTNSGLGFVRPDAKPGDPPPPDILIRAGRELDAASGDRVLVKLIRRSKKLDGARGEIVEIIERSTRTYVGSYFERDGEAFVRVDGTTFARSVAVGDPGTKGAKPNDKVQIDLIKFPTAAERGEGVIVEVFGPLSQPGVDTLTVIRALGIPDVFPEEALAEARSQADAFREELGGRTDFTKQLVVTVDPIDAKDFDDAVNVELDPKSGHTVLTVHIADVAHFVKPGGHLDTEARKRGTSVYLPQRVIPMFPELISNGLASLQEGKLRYVKTVQIEFTADMQIAHTDFFNGAIRVAKRFAYEQVQALLDAPEPVASADPAILAMLHRMKALALKLRAKRIKRGALELSMPEAVLEYSPEGRVVGAHFASNDLSHQIIEEFMLAANVAVAEKLTSLDVPFLRRVHPAPKPEKLYAFGQFAAVLGYPMKKSQDRFELQALLEKTAATPERAAIHFSLLRSLKQASYSPIQDEHYALAFQQYCHFTSPIRRYPDLQVHRLMDRFIRSGKVAANERELIVLGDHCSKTERRAEIAERELVKLRILQYLADKIDTGYDAVITNVAEYGFFAQATAFPAEGMVHVSTLRDDYYVFDADEYSLRGQRSQTRFRLGDEVRVEVARVDLAKRQLDWRLVERKIRSAKPKPDSFPKPFPKARSGKPKGLPKARKKHK